jgi:PEGA domain
MDVQHSDDEELLALQGAATEFVSHLDVSRPDETPALHWAPDAAERSDVAQSEPRITRAIPATTIAAADRELSVSLMSCPPPENDRSGRAPLVPPGPFAPPVPTPGAATGASSRFSFLPEEPMKRPPPDPGARVYTSTERTQAALVAREDALRHPAPFAIGRVVGDVRDGTVIGTSIIARTASASAIRFTAIAAAAVQLAARTVRAVCVFSFALARRSMLLAVNAVRAVGGAVVSGGRVGWHTATAATQAVARSIAAVYTFTPALARRSMLGTASAGRGVGGAVVSGGRVLWHVTARIVTGILLALLAIGLGLAAIVVGIVTAARTGIVLLARATNAGSRQLWDATRVASRSGAAAGLRASVAAGKALARGRAVSSDAATRASATHRAFFSPSADTVSGVRLTIRWRPRSTRPIVGAAVAEFARQLAGAVRQVPPRLAVAGFAVAVAVLIAAVYGLPRRDRRIAGGTTAPPSSSLASVAPAPGAETAALVPSLKKQSAALLAPSPKPKGRPSAAPAAAATADADRRADVPRGQSMLGTLTIASAPKGAKVTIDGIPRGLSPLSVSRLRAGNRIVRLELAGYRRWSWAVYVSASRPTRLNVSLVPDSGLSPSSAATNTAAAAK